MPSGVSRQRSPTLKDSAEQGGGSHVGRKGKRCLIDKGTMSSGEDPFSPVWFHVTAWILSVCGLNSAVSAGPDPLAAVSLRFQSLTDAAHDATAAYTHKEEDFESCRGFAVRTVAPSGGHDIQGDRHARLQQRTCGMVWVVVVYGWQGPPDLGDEGPEPCRQKFNDRKIRTLPRATVALTFPLTGIWIWMEVPVEAQWSALMEVRTPLMP